MTAAVLQLVATPEEMLQGTIHIDEAASIITRLSNGSLLTCVRVYHISNKSADNIQLTFGNVKGCINNAPVCIVIAHGHAKTSGILIEPLKIQQNQAKQKVINVSC